MCPREAPSGMTVCIERRDTVLRHEDQYMFLNADSLGKLSVQFQL